MLKKLKYLLLTSIATSLLSGSAIACCKENEACDTEIKFNGLLHLQSAFRQQNRLESDEKNLSANKKNFTLYTEASFFALANHKVDNVTYGLNLVLTPTTKAKTSTSYNGSHLFVETEFGKFEAGAPHDAGSKMRVTGDDVVAGTGDWSRYTVFTSKAMQYNGLAPNFEDGSNYFYNGMFKTKIDSLNDKTEPSRKISYFTPEFYGAQIGISYIPDSANIGGADYNTTTKGGITNIPPTTPANPATNLTAVIDRNVKDGFSGGVSYKKELNDEFAVKVAATGEYGKAAKQAIINDKKYKLTDLKTYNLGTVLTYNNFSLGLSYGSLGKSLTTKEFNKTGKGTKYYNSAVGYGQGPVKASISYFNSDSFGNKLQSVTLGTEYALMSKFVVYAEVSGFEAKGKAAYYSNAPKKKVRGTVTLIGAKAKF